MEEIIDKLNFTKCTHLALWKQYQDNEKTSHRLKENVWKRHTWLRTIIQTHKVKVKVTQSCLTLCDPISSSRASLVAQLVKNLPALLENCPWNSPGQNTRVGSLSLLQWIFPPRYWTGVSCIAGRNIQRSVKIQRKGSSPFFKGPNFNRPFNRKKSIQNGNKFVKMHHILCHQGMAN